MISAEVHRTYSPSFPLSFFRGWQRINVPVSGTHSLPPRWWCKIGAVSKLKSRAVDEFEADPRGCTTGTGTRERKGRKGRSRREQGPRFDGMGIRSLFSVAICAVYFDGPRRPRQIELEDPRNTRGVRWSKPLVIGRRSLLSGKNDGSRGVTLIATCSPRNIIVLSWRLRLPLAYFSP